MFQAAGRLVADTTHFVVASDCCGLATPVGGSLAALAAVSVAKESVEVNGLVDTAVVVRASEVAGSVLDASAVGSVMTTGLLVAGWEHSTFAAGLVVDSRWSAGYLEAGSTGVVVRCWREYSTVGMIGVHSTTAEDFGFGSALVVGTTERTSSALQPSHQTYHPSSS